MNTDRVVVDANIAFKALCSERGDLRDRLGPAAVLTFYSPRFVFVELFKHKERLAFASRASEEVMVIAADGARALDKREAAYAKRKAR